MTGHSARIFRFASVLLLIASAAFAQKQRDLNEVMKIMGDGAAECSATKIAASLHGPRNQFSVASPNLDATFYHLNLYVPMGTPAAPVDSVIGVVRVEGRVINSTLTTLILDLASSMLVESVKLPDGTPLAYTHPGAALHITLPSAQTVGSLVAVDISYRGIPVSDGFGNFVFGTHSVNRGGDRFAWSLSEPYGAREWWPCKDHPSDKVDSVRVTVTVPSEFRVASQGLMLSQTVVGPNTRYQWFSRYPITSYLVSVAIGTYVVHFETYTRPPALAAEYGALTMPLYHYRYDDITPELPVGWANVDDVFEVEEEWFGPYPFATEKYGHAEVTFSGGMEHQTMCSISSSAPGVVAHELAHQWYGDSISPERWKHLWLNEGFASYAEAMYLKARESDYPGFWQANTRSRYISARDATGTLVLQDTSSVNTMFDPTRVYSKGAIVLNMLEYVTGTPVFKAILKAYAADPAVKYGNAVTADFQRVAETVSGSDLDYFFREWITDGTGYPTYSATSKWTEMTGGYHVTVKLAQGQTSPQSNMSVFDMPVEIAVMAESGDSVVEVYRSRVRNNQRTQEFQFHVPVPDSTVISSVRIDPDKRILRSDQITTIAQTPSIPIITFVAPNPTHGSVQVQYTLDTDSAVDIHVFDVRGRRVLTERVSGTEGISFATIDTSRLSSGVYFLRLTTEKGEAKTKFVLVR